MTIGVILCVIGGLIFGASLNGHSIFAVFLGISLIVTGFIFT